MVSASVWFVSDLMCVLTWCVAANPADVYKQKLNLLMHRAGLKDESPKSRSVGGAFASSESASAGSVKMDGVPAMTDSFEKSLKLQTEQQRAAAVQTEQANSVSSLNALKQRLAKVKDGMV